MNLTPHKSLAFCEQLTPVEKGDNNENNKVPCNHSYSLIFVFSFLCRVVTVSSRAGNMAAKKCSDELKAKFTSPDTTVPLVEQLMTDFVR